ncbi:hypothetical protein AAHA92_01735 [Salvia divinorum]|uniref:Uncharacterized protein n=1 Tax=Salvia divinorum TaxID=28513 RepID=A0ABD1IBJ2_SALDI
MTRQQRQIPLRHSSSLVARRQPLLEAKGGGGPQDRLTARLAEVVGGTTAECAAVCCCCPCGLVNLLVLAVCKVPAGLCRKALRRKRRHRLVKMGLRPAAAAAKCTCDEKDFQIRPVPAPDSSESVPDSTEVIELDKEMFDRFYAGGFWRSSSARM